MIIRYAEEKNFIELRQFYDGMCKVLSGKDFLPEGDKGGFPPDEMIKDAIKERNQFIGIEDGRIVAAYIMNHDRDEAYHAVKWLIDANDNETVVLHALRVLPEYGGHGYSKQLVQHAIDTARERNLKSIRLDCIEGNDIPQKMYMSFGFKYVDKVEITCVGVEKTETCAYGVEGSNWTVWVTGGDIISDLDVYGYTENNIIFKVTHDDYDAYYELLFNMDNLLSFAYGTSLGAMDDIIVCD